MHNVLYTKTGSRKMQGDGKSAGTRPDRGLVRTGLEVAIYCSLLAAMIFVPSVAQAQTDAERAALVALYDATDGDNWTDNTNWKSQEPVGTWHGVTVENGAVTGLDLSDNNLTGEIPSAIGDLTNLEWLILKNNSLSGAIPTEIGNLTNLDQLHLENNSLSGAIPTEIGNLTSLDQLGLGSNLLSGSIPSEIGNLTNLRFLLLRGNQLTGSIPTEIGNLTRLEQLYFSGNSLSGAIPTEIGNWTRLEILQLDGNSLSGAIPTEIGNLTRLTWLSLEGNNLTGAIPAEIGNLTRLEVLRGDRNQLSGSIPAEIGNLTSLQNLSLEHNNLTGAIPAEIGNLTSLGRLDLWQNSLSGEIPSEIGNLTNLEVLWLHDNQLSGAIPSEIGNLTSLAWLDLRMNSLSGPMPAEIGNLTSLESLRLDDNQLSGSIPVEIGNLTDLRRLYLDSNSLSGAIPAEIGNLTRLHWLLLSSNSLSGEIPSEIGNLTGLGFLIIDSNSLSGAIPAEIANLTSLEWLLLNDNTELTGELPAGLRLLPITILNIRNTCITTPADSDFQAWLLGIDFSGTDRVCAAGVTVTPTTLSVPEGSNAKYTVVLDTQPSADVTISLSFASGSDEDITVDKTSLTFTTDNWNAAQEVTVSAAEDDDATDGAATIEHSASGGDYGNVSVSSVTATEADNDNDADAERAALVAIYDATDGDNWTNNTNWKSQEPVGDWYGVTVENGVVTELSLGLNDLTGALPSEIGDLTNLERLNLSGNALSGEIPEEIGNLTRLEELWLTGNALSGEIPSEIGKLTSLRRLLLDNNDLSGAIPSEIGKLTSLEGLWLSINSLSGAIPSEIGNLTRLEALGLSINSLSGAIPAEIWNLTRLRALGLNENVLSGEIPEEIGNLTRLEKLNLFTNNLTGAIPSAIGNLTSLQQLWLHDNALTGAIPSTIGNLTNLELLYLNNNSLSGAIPSEIGNLTSLERLDLGYNTELTGELPAGLRLLPINYLDIRETCIATPADSDFQAWLAGIRFFDTDRVCVGGVTVTPTALSVPEGSNAKYTVVLDTQPSADVTIAVSFASGSDADITVDKNSLTFTTENWDTAQEVTVSAAEDDDALNGSATIEHTASGGGYGGVSVSSVTVTEADNDAAGVTVTPTALSVPEGSNAKYTVVLNAQPSADVTISLSFASGSDEDITVDKTSLAFTPDNWNAAQEVTVSAAEDTDTANGTATIDHMVSGGGYDNVSVSSVTVTEADNDAAGITVTPTTLSVPEGSNAKYTVVLDAQPSANVTISVSFASSSDEDITVDKTSLAFTPDNWDAAQEIIVLAAEDDDALNGVATIEHSASGGGYDNVSVSSVTATEADNDAAGVTVTPTALTVPEGSNVKYTVVLDTQPSEEVTISLSFASGSDEDITVDKTSLTFTPDNWDAAQEVTVSAAEDDDALNGVATIEHSASDGGYGGVSVSSVTATEEDNDTAGVTVTPTALTVAEGGSATYTVVLDTQPSDDVTITVSFASGSDEDITVDKTSLTFTPDNWSMAQEVTVSAAVDNDIDDDAAVLNHKASGGDYGEVTIADVVVTVTDVIGGVDVSGWLARYSRVGAGHLLSSLENRMERLDRTSSGAEVSVAGQRIVFGDSPARPGMELSGASAIWSASQSYTTSSLDGRRSVGLMKPFGMTSGLNAAARRYTNMTLRDALSRSAFRYAREMSSGNSFGVWGQGSFSRFSGSESGEEMYGDVMSGTVGVDNSFSGWLHGLAVSRSESEGAYRIAGKDSLSLSASLTGIYPYARYKITDRLRVWGTGGYGRGSLRLQGDSLASSSSDLSMALGSIGVSGDIVSAGSQGFGLSWQTDAMLLRSSLASSRSLSSVEAIVHRLRLSLESSYILRMGDRASLAPKLRLGVRRDGGDAEQGMGLDVAGGLGFVNSAWGLRAQVDMHGMLVHEDSDFEQWGVSGMILFDRSPSLDIGASLRLFPSWGSASSSTGGMRALWSRETVSGLAGFRRTGSDDRSLRLAGRFDYGFAAFGKSGVTTPYASFSLSGNEARGAVADTGVELGGGLGYSNKSLGLRMQAGVRGLMSDEAMAFDQWGASGVVAFDPDPSSPLGASFNVSPSWGIAPVSGFGSSQNMGGMRQREPLPRSVTGMSRPNLYGQPMRIEGEMGYGFSASGGKGVATPYAGVAFSDRDRSGVLLGLNLQAGRRFLLNVEGSTPKVRAISFDSMPEFRVRGLLKW